MVCITSRIGLKIISKIELREANMPSGIPIMTQKRTAVKIIASVVMVSDQTSTRSMKTKLNIVNRAKRIPLVL